MASGQSEHIFNNYYKVCSSLGHKDNFNSAIQLLPPRGFIAGDGLVHRVSSSLISSARPLPNRPRKMQPQTAFSRFPRCWLPSYWKEDTVAGTGFTKSEHQVCIFAVIGSMAGYVRVRFCVSIPLIPGPPMTAIVIPMPFIVVVAVMTTFVIGALPVSAIFVVIRTTLGFLHLLLLPLFRLSFSLVSLIGKCLRGCQHEKPE